MTVHDNGPEPNAFNIETETVDNANYRTVAWSGKYLQVTLMSIPVGESIGLESHPDTDQFLRLDAGQGRVTMGPAEDDLPFQQDVEDARHHRAEDGAAVAHLRAVDLAVPGGTAVHQLVA